MSESIAPGGGPRAGRPFHFCFTLDTEPDDLWADRPTLTFDHFHRLADFHRELTDRGARPTYLTTSEVAEHLPAARALGRVLDAGRAELGAHFHAWTRAWPFPVPDLGPRPLHALAHQLGQPVEERMLAFTCDVLARAFRVRPVSYRGGKWSLNEASALSLARCGIRVDTTVTPGIHWQDRRHPLLDGPDFRGRPRHPHYLRPPGRDAVLELPVGTADVPPPRPLPSRGVVGKVVRRALRATGRPVGLTWLRPTLMSRRELRACLRALRADGVPVWVSMIHSSEIVPCKYFATEGAVRAFRRRCLELVEDAVALGATGATLREAWEQHGGEQHEAAA
jgi:hypothetical protein